MLADTTFLTVFLCFVNIKATEVEGSLRVYFNEYPVIKTKYSRSDKEISGW